MSNLNPENKCSHLIKDFEHRRFDNPVEEMFQMQNKLQKFLAKKGRAIDYDEASFKDRVDDISRQWRNLNLEIAELIERLPYKEWKSYPQHTLDGDIEDEEMLEIMFEYIDCWHFFMNIGLALGIDGEMFEKLYAIKNKENFDRQEGKYK